METALRRETPDHILHLGDCVPDAIALKKHGIPITLVAGNCDWGSSEPTVLTPEFEQVRIYMTHGHLHSVKMQYQRIIYAGLEAGARILLFGHTHRAELFTHQGMQIMNPGPCNQQGSYGLITIEHGAFQCCVKSVQ